MNTFTIKELSERFPKFEFNNLTIEIQNLSVNGFSPIYPGKINTISYVSNKKFLDQIEKTSSNVILISKELYKVKDNNKLFIVVDNLDLSLIELLNLFYPLKTPENRIEKLSFIHPTTQVLGNSYIGNFVSIGKNSKIGKNCYLDDGVKIGDNVILGDNARIGKNTIIMDDVMIGDYFITGGNCSIGGDGFRFSFINGQHLKIPQVGKVIIGNNVELGSNSAIDRGGLDDTIIGDGCKFDNMVHIAHNVTVGKNVVIAGCSGIAGSTTIGNNVLVGGAVAISDHLNITDGTMIGGGTVIRKSIEEKNVYVGWDGFTFSDYQKLRINVKQLIQFQKILKRIKDIEEKMGIKTD